MGKHTGKDLDQTYEYDLTDVDDILAEYHADLSGSAPQLDYDDFSAESAAEPVRPEAESSFEDYAPYASDESYEPDDRVDTVDLEGTWDENYVPSEFEPGEQAGYDYESSYAEEERQEMPFDNSFAELEEDEEPEPDPEPDPNFIPGYVRPELDPDDEEIRAYVRAFAKDFLDIRQEPVTVPQTDYEIDSRFFMGEGMSPSSLSYDGATVDTSADADYVPHVTAEEFVSSYAPDNFSETAAGRRSRAETEEEEPEPVGGVAAKLSSLRSRLPHREKPQPDVSEQDDFFPSSFREYVLSLLTSFVYRFRRVEDAHVTENIEGLGPEVPPSKAYKYYGGFLRSASLRIRIMLVLLVIMGWLSFGLPVTGMLKSTVVSGAVCMGMELCVLLLGLDVFTNSLLRLFHGDPGIDSVASVACLLCCLDALITAKTDFGPMHMAACFTSAVGFFGVALSSFLSCKALRKSLKVPAIGKHPYSVTCNPSEHGLRILKSVRPFTGFVRRSEEAPFDEEIFDKVCIPLALLAVVMALLCALLKKSFSGIIYLLSLFLSCSVPFTALLGFALPFFVGSFRLFSSGAAIAGWSGAEQLGLGKDLIVTDRDLFPEGTVEIDNIRIFGEEDPKHIIEYAGSMLTVSGSCVAGCFDELMKDNECRICQVENHEYLPGGGMRAVIESNVILCGSVEFMQLMNVKIPFRLVSDTSVLLAVNGVLCGIFNVHYKADPKVRQALVDLIRSNRHPVFAIRDFNITPSMLHETFDVATDGYDFPPYIERYGISSAEIDEDVKISAVVCREGLGALVQTADTGRSIYVATRINTVISIISAVFCLFFVFIRILAGGGISLATIFIIGLVFLLPVLFFSFVLKF